MKYAAKALGEQPLTGMEAAYDKACAELPLWAEKREDREAMLHLFRQLGSGSTSMREQAVAAAMRRLKPAVEHARKTAHTGGKLCMQLGVLLGLMAGIALW
jgi:stage III sporulation protein AB